MSHNTVLSKDTIYSILESFANHYISQDNVLPINIYIVGGSAIVMCFDYRQSTIDIDALYEKNYQVDLAIKETALEKNVPSDWLNSVLLIHHLIHQTLVRLLTYIKQLTTRSIFTA